MSRKTKVTGAAGLVVAIAVVTAAVVTVAPWSTRTVAPTARSAVEGDPFATFALPQVRSASQGNPMAHIGLDCLGGGAGSLTFDGTGRGDHPTARAAAVTALAGEVNLSQATRREGLLLPEGEVQVGRGGRVSADYVLVHDDRIVFRVHLTSPAGGTSWTMTGSSTCVDDTSADRR